MKYQNVIISTLIILLSVPCLLPPAYPASSQDERSGDTVTQLLSEGTRHAQNGDFDRARQLYDQAVQLAPAMAAFVHINMGKAYAAKGRWNESINEMEKAVELNPSDIMTIFNLANIYQSAGKLDKTIQAYKRIISIDSNLYWAHYTPRFAL